MGGEIQSKISLSDQEIASLEGFANSRSLPHSIVLRSRIILLSNEGRQRKEVAKSLGIGADTVRKWCKRYLCYGIKGLYDELRPGKPRSISDDRIAELIDKTLNSTPKGATHWSIRSMAKEVGVSRSTVQRVWKTFALQPHRQKHFKLSTDPFFIEKVRDIVGLYLNPPENALVLCVDEKSQCQALERTQPMLPLNLGYVEGVTHDYYRHGTTTLFAALDVANGNVITKCHQRHRHEEFLSFLKTIDKNVPKDLDIHIVLDNYLTHKHEEIKQWLKKKKRYHFHFTPTYSSWLNQVERWFGIITEKTIRRGSFTSVTDLRKKIEIFVENWNAKASPFKWTATADSILEKVEKLCRRIYESPH